MLLTEFEEFMQKYSPSYVHSALEGWKKECVTIDHVWEKGDPQDVVYIATMPYVLSPLDIGYFAGYLEYRLQWLTTDEEVCDLIRPHQGPYFSRSKAAARKLESLLRKHLSNPADVVIVRAAYIRLLISRMEEEADADAFRHKLCAHLSVAARYAEDARKAYLPDSRPPAEQFASWLRRKTVGQFYLREASRWTGSLIRLKGRKQRCDARR